MTAPIISSAFPKSGTTIVSASTYGDGATSCLRGHKGGESQPSKEYATDHRVSCEAFPVLVSFQHSRAMAQSSCARITSTRTGESDAAISSSGDGLALLFSFNLRPINPKTDKSQLAAGRPAHLRGVLSHSRRKHECVNPSQYGNHRTDTCLQPMHVNVEG